MSNVYSSYNKIDKQYIDLNESLYEKYTKVLPTIPTALKDELGGKVVVFNLWMSIYPVNKYLVIKP